MNKIAGYPCVILLVVLMSGCVGDDDRSSDATITVTPVVEETATASPIATQQASAAVQTTPSPSVKSDIFKGDTLKDQSFRVSFENFGDSEFLTTVEEADGRSLPHFYFKNKGTVSELKYKQEAPGSPYTVSAVSFRDVSGDGKKDIIVITDYTTGGGYMGAIPISQVIVFKQTDSGFTEDKTIEERARAGVPYRILTVQDVLTGLATKPEDSIARAWQRLKPGNYKLEGSNELVGSWITVTKASGDGLLFNLDAYYAHSKEAAEQGGVNIGTIESGKASPSDADMIFRDQQFNYELSIYLISDNSLYLRDNGESYYGKNVSVNGAYTFEEKK